MILEWNKKYILPFSYFSRNCSRFGVYHRIVWCHDKYDIVYNTSCYIAYNFSCSKYIQIYSSKEYRHCYFWNCYEHFGSDGISPESSEIIWKTSVLCWKIKSITVSIYLFNPRIAFDLGMEYSSEGRIGNLIVLFILINFDLKDISYVITIKRLSSNQFARCCWKNIYYSDMNMHKFP